MIETVQQTNGCSPVEAETVAQSLRNEMWRLTPDSITPLDERLWVERIPPQTETDGGLVIPTQAETTQNYGVVLKVAEGVTDLREGDIVMFEAYDGQEISFSDRKCLLIEHDQIKAKIESPI